MMTYSIMDLYFDESFTMEEKHSILIGNKEHFQNYELAAIDAILIITAGLLIDIMIHGVKNDKHKKRT